MSRAEDIEQRASEWLSRKDRGEWSRQDQVEYDAWLAAGPAHAIAVARLEEVWKEADILARHPAPRPHHRTFRRFAMPAAMAASLAALATGGWIWEMRGSVLHRTQIGQHAEVRLRDGSNVSLNTNTKVIAVVADGTREVWLDHGEAFFEIAHDRAHPFDVHAGKEVITVLGTRFTVRQEGERFRVSVLSGRVRLASLARSEDRPIDLDAGKVATVTGDDVLVSSETQHAQLDDLAWRRGTIVFDRATLAQAVADLNRYSERKLVIADPQLDDVEIGGRFSTDNVVSFAQLLQDSLNLKVREHGDEIEIAQ